MCEECIGDDHWSIEGKRIKKLKNQDKPMQVDMKLFMVEIWWSKEEVITSLSMRLLVHEIS